LANNKGLRQAAKAKQDEFYTQLIDIEKELKHYKAHFKNKIVFCNCDDPYESNFFKYFAMNFNHLGLKKLMATCYDSSPVAYTQFNLFGESKCVPNENRHPYKIEITEVEDYNHDGATDLADVRYLLKNKKNTLCLLEGNGDFRSAECVELLKQADIVVTNPPFSLFREYVAQLVAYDKKFVIIGNQNAITYKETFALLKNNKIWVGFGFNISLVYKTQYKNNLEANRKFVKAKGYNPDENYIKVPGVCWFTNLDICKRHEDLVLYKKYNPIEYPKYDNYEAINVDKVADIPYDYNGYMGVPITYLDKYNPNQFEIIGLGVGKNFTEELKCAGLAEEFVKKYYLHGGKGSYSINHPILGYYNNKGLPVIPYARVIIKRRNKNEN